VSHVDIDHATGERITQNVEIPKKKMFDFLHSHAKPPLKILSNVDDEIIRQPKERKKKKVMSFGLRSWLLLGKSQS
jgi:hypothetical protein